MSRFEWTSLVLQGVTLLAASYFAFTQGVVNDRLARLEDYVSVSAVPDGTGVKFINTGGSNVYIHDVSVDGKETHLRSAAANRRKSRRRVHIFYSDLI